MNKLTKEMLKEHFIELRDSEDIEIKDKVLNFLYGVLTTLYFQRIITCDQYQMYIDIVLFYRYRYKEAV